MSTLHANNQIEYDNTHNGLYDLVLIFCACIFFMSVVLEMVWLMNFMLMAIYFICTIAFFKEKRYGCFLFCLTFFLFLLDTVFFGLFDPSLKYKFRSVEIEKHTILSLGIALIGLYVGGVSKQKFTFGFGKRKKNGFTNPHSNVQNLASSTMQRFLRYSFLFSSIFSIIEAIVKAIFVGANSYVAYYSDFQTSLPYFMQWLSLISPILFYLYLGSLPKRKSVMLPVMMYLAVGIIALFYGQRNVFVIRILLVVCYFMIRNKYSESDEVWITKRQVALAIIAIPLGIAFMAVWGVTRFGSTYTERNIFRIILNGFLDQGNDIAILDYEYRFRDILPNKPFAIGGIITLLHNNIIGRIIGLSQIPAKQNTVEIALQGYSFSAALMYEQNRNGFLLGYGIGSCYIAELINSFGYIGALLGSIVYGGILRKLGEVRLRGFISNGIALSMFAQLLKAPRASFDGFVSVTFQIANIFILVLCWALNKYVWPGESS